MNSFFFFSSELIVNRILIVSIVIVLLLLLLLLLERPSQELFLCGEDLTLFAKMQLFLMKMIGIKL